MTGNIYGKNLARFEGKVAVITGATQGLGETIAREFAARGLAGAPAWASRR